MTSPSRMCPDFFAMYLPELNRDRLRIPIDFVEHLNGFMPEKANLRDYVGRVWKVELGQIGKSMYFLKGWQQFLMEKSAEEGDFLVFRYAGNSIFDFKLLGRTECEKKDSEEVDLDIYKKDFCVKEKDVEEAVEEEVEERKEEKEGEKEEDAAEEEDVEDNEEEEENTQPNSPNMESAVLKHKYSTRGHPTIKKKNYYEAEEEEVEDAEEEEEKSQPKIANMDASVVKHKCSTRSRPTIKRKNYYEAEEVEDDEEKEEKSQPKFHNMEAAVLKHKYSTRGHPTIKRKNYYEAEEEEVEDNEEEEEKSQPKSPNMEAAVLKHKYSTRGHSTIKRRNYFEAEEGEVEDDEEEEEKSQPKSPNMEAAVLEHKYSTRGHSTIKRRNYYEDEDEEMEDDEEEEEKSQPKSHNMEVAVLKHKYSSRGRQTIKRKKYCCYEQSAVERTRAVYEETAHTMSKYRKAFSTQDMVDCALSIERNFESKNPFFIANLRLCRRQLLIPPDMLKDFKIALPPMVSLRDPYGRLWPGKVVFWKDGRTLIGGWNNFCKHNRLGENDICICEFVLENGHHGDLIVVHIHRYNPERMS